MTLLQFRTPIAQTLQNSLTDTATTIAIATTHEADTTTTAPTELMTEVRGNPIRRRICNAIPPKMITPLIIVIRAALALNIF